MANLWPFRYWFAKPGPAAQHGAPVRPEPVDPDRVHIAPAEDSDFQWLLSNGRVQSRRGFSLAPGGLETPRTLSALRALNAKVRDADNPGAWLILLDQEVAGLCSYKMAPRDTGEIEIGYGIAASRHGRGIGRAAIALMLARSQEDPRIHTLTAQTALHNAPSQRLLMRLGFTSCGYGYQPGDGPLRLWRLKLR